VVDKTYHYRLLNRPLPSALIHRHTWHIRQPLDLVAMKAAATLLSGEHDFKSFEAAGSPRAHTVRTIYDSRLMQQEEEWITYCIRANGFLRYMVRNIVGTLAEVGRGLREAESIPDLLRQRDRRLAAATAPANGLFLVAVSYPPEKRGMAPHRP
jgi:tRNA pseudouridine38-40 synthase